MVSPPLTRQDWYVALAFTMLALLVGSWYMIVGVAGAYHDDGIYLSTAKALAEGRGYHLINLPEAPAQTKYPPLYPLFLAIIWKISPAFPDNLVFMQLFTLLCGAAVVGLSYLYLVRFGYCSRGVAAGAGALTLTSIYYVYFSTITLSELPFALAVLAALSALEKQDESPFLTPGRQFFLGVLLSLPMLVRTIGVLFVPLGLLRLWKRGIPLRWAILGMALFLLPWLIWMLLVPRWFATDSVGVYYTNYLTWWYSTGKTGFSQIITYNGFLAVLQTMMVGVSLFHPFFHTQAWTSILAFILGLITWTYMIKDVLRGRILAAFLVLYLLIILVWPWPPIRFLVPLTPFLLAYFLGWTKGALQRVPRIGSARLAFFLWAVLLVINVAVMARMVQINRNGHYPLVSKINKAVSWQSYEDTFRWIKQNTKPGEVIASGLDTMIFLYTGRQAFRPFQGRPASLFYGSPDPALGSWKEVVQFLERRQARFLVSLPMPGFSEERHFAEVIGQIIVNCPGLLELVYEGPDKRFLIYGIDKARLVDFGPTP